MTYTVRLTTTGDEGYADDLGAALRTARQLVDDVSTHGGVYRHHRAGLLVMRDGRYDGAATAAAQRGAN